MDRGLTSDLSVARYRRSAVRSYVLGMGRIKAEMSFSRSLLVGVIRPPRGD